MVSCKNIALGAWISSTPPHSRVEHGWEFFGSWVGVGGSVHPTGKWGMNTPTLMSQRYRTKEYRWTRAEARERRPGSVASLLLPTSFLSHFWTLLGSCSSCHLYLTVTPA